MMNSSLSFPTALSLTLAFAASACNEDERLHEQTVHFIGPEGGIARSADGLASISVERGAFTVNQNIVITTHRKMPVEDSASFVYQIEPDQLAFSSGVSFKIVVNDGLDPEDIVMEQVDDMGETLEVLETSFSDEDETLVSPLEHFSYYVLRRSHRACRNLSCGDVCQLCPPNRPQCKEPPVQRMCNPHGLCVRSSTTTCGGEDVDGGSPGDIDGGPGSDCLIVIGSSTGTPPLSPPFEATPNFVDFGDVPTGCASSPAFASAILKIRNVTDEPATLFSMYPYPGRNDIQLYTDNLPSTLDPQAVWTATVAWSPVGEGPLCVSLDVGVVGGIFTIAGLTGESVPNPSCP